MQQYERIGGQRDELEIARLISEIDLQDSTTKKELDHRPFVAPEIIKEVTQDQYLESMES